MRHTIYCTLLSAALLGIPAHAQEAKPQQLLRMAFQVGKTQYYQQSMTMHMNMDAGGTKMETKMNLEFTVSMKVAGVKDGKADLEYAFHHLVMKVEGPTQTDYDSDVAGSDAGPMSSMTDMIGKVITAKMDERGRVSDVHLPEGLDAQSMQMFASGGMENFIGQNIPTLPEKPIAIGDSWNTEIAMPSAAMPGAKMKSTNKLIKVDGGKATVAQQLELDLGGAQLPGGGEMKVEKAGGTMVIDLATGMLVESDADMAMKVDGGAGGMQMTNTTTAKNRAIEPPPAKAKAAAAKTDAGK